MSSAEQPEPEPPTYLIERILITNRQRLGQFRHPRTRERLTHGLGRVNEPIRPYLGHRISHSKHATLDDPGYNLALPTKLRAVAVYAVTFDVYGIRMRRGSRQPTKALGAPDVTRKGTLEPLPRPPAPALPAPPPAQVIALQHITDFLDQHCVSSENTRTSAAAIYTAYRGWCARHKYPAATQTALGLALGRAGYTRAKRGTVFWQGVTLVAEPPDDLDG